MTSRRCARVDNGGVHQLAVEDAVWNWLQNVATDDEYEAVLDCINGLLTWNPPYRIQIANDTWVLLMVAGFRLAIEYRVESPHDLRRVRAVHSF